MSINKRVIFGAYFTFLGLTLFVVSLLTGRIDANSKGSVYNKVLSDLEYLVKKKNASYIFRIADHDDFDDQVREIRKAMVIFKNKYVEKVTPWVVTITILGICAGLAYLIFGAMILSSHFQAKHMPLVTLILWVMYLSVFIRNAYIDVDFLDAVLVQFLNLSHSSKPTIEKFGYTFLSRKYFGYVNARIGVYFASHAFLFLLPTVSYYFHFVRPDLRNTKPNIGIEKYKQSQFGKWKI